MVAFKCALLRHVFGSSISKKRDILRGEKTIYCKTILEQQTMFAQMFAGKQCLKKSQTKYTYKSYYKFSKADKEQVNFFSAISQIVMEIIILLFLKTKSLDLYLKYF